ncbi:hypothetical protein O3P69_000625 [Scylla paramamosain]|uniref:Reverse transcriptase domain-containing protein n=1 Tax=Scylla paramamosain TaxID=85552 RepID=A0AAW0UQA1_SCYPA
MSISAREIHVAEIWEAAFPQTGIQTAATNGKTLQACKVAIGVPQGSVPGSLLFLVLMGKIDNEVQNAMLASFTDDSNIGKTISSHSNNGATTASHHMKCLGIHLSEDDTFHNHTLEFFKKTRKVERHPSHYWTNYTSESRDVITAGALDHRWLSGKTSELQSRTFPTKFVHSVFIPELHQYCFAALTPKYKTQTVVEISRIFKGYYLQSPVEPTRPVLTSHPANFSCWRLVVVKKARESYLGGAFTGSAQQFPEAPDGGCGMEWTCNENCWCHIPVQKERGPPCYQCVIQNCSFTSSTPVPSAPPLRALLDYQEPSPVPHLYEEPNTASHLYSHPYEESSTSPHQHEGTSPPSHQYQSERHPSPSPPPLLPPKMLQQR